KFKVFRIGLAQSLEPLGIRRVRSVQDIYIRAPLKSPTYWLGFFWKQKIRRQFATTDHFFMPRLNEGQWSRTLLERLPVNSDKTIEVGVHPGYSEPWRIAEGKEIREFANRARDAGHQLIGWKDLAIN